VEGRRRRRRGRRRRRRGEGGRRRWRRGWGMRMIFGWVRLKGGREGGEEGAQ
jgi:hypothetical protein